MEIQEVRLSLIWGIVTHCILCYHSLCEFLKTVVYTWGEFYNLYCCCFNYFGTAMYSQMLRQTSSFPVLFHTDQLMRYNGKAKEPQHFITALHTPLRKLEWLFKNLMNKEKGQSGRYRCTFNFPFISNTTLFIIHYAISSDFYVRRKGAKKGDYLLIVSCRVIQ